MDINIFLSIGAALSAIVAVLHIGCIYFGATWYRTMGAGEKMAMLAERGSIRPTLITSTLVVIFIIWSLYALSGAGVISDLPLLRLALMIITSIYLLRGLLGFIFYFKPLGRTPEFWLWSSGICSVLGLIHLIGLQQVWAQI